MNTGPVVSYDAVVFDLDGTLIDSTPVLRAAVRSAVADCNVAVPDDDVLAGLRGAPLDRFFEILVDGPQKALGRPDAVDISFFEARFLFHHDQGADPNAYDGVADLLAKISVPMGIATTKPTPRAREALEFAGLTSYFTSIMGTDDGVAPKPAPEIVEMVCAAMGVEPSSVLMVGDTDRDIGAAQNAGALAVGVRHGPQGPSDLFGNADHIVAGIDGLASLLGDLGLLSR